MKEAVLRRIKMAVGADGTPTPLWYPASEWLQRALCFVGNATGAFCTGQYGNPHHPSVGFRSFIRRRRSVGVKR
jgi:hypothetical protein